jgi:SRSO17 transposase
MTIYSTSANLQEQETLGRNGELPSLEQSRAASPRYSSSGTEVEDPMSSLMLSSDNISEEQFQSVALTSRNLGPIPIAELRQYLSQFSGYFRRSEGRRSLERHLLGLLSDIDRKNEEQIAQVVAGTNSQRLQALLTELHWEAGAVNHLRVQQLVREATVRGGTLVCGETEMQKQGRSSVGVARQYVDDLGKVKNCQLLVSWQYVDSAFSWPVNARLYLPHEWVQDSARCQKARIPEGENIFLSKSEIALRLLDEASQWGIPYRHLVTTASYGSEPLFLEGLEQRQVEYLVAVPEDFAVQVARRRDPSGESVRDIIARLSDDAWQPISWPRSVGYGRRNLWARAMGWRTTSVGPGAFGWLVAERPLSANRDATHYYFTNVNIQTSLGTIARLARRARRLEEFYHFAKNDLGWNQYEGRLWHGLHRHMLLVFLATSFLTLQSKSRSYEEG